MAPSKFFVLVHSNAQMLTSHVYRSASGEIILVQTCYQSHDTHYVRSLVYFSVSVWEPRLLQFRYMPLRTRLHLSVVVSSCHGSCGQVTLSRSPYHATYIIVCRLRSVSSLAPAQI